MIILLQELKIKAVSDLSLKDDNDLIQALSDGSLVLFTVIFDLGSDDFQDLCLVRLILLVANVESDLVSIKVGVTVLVLGQFLEQVCCSLRELKVELALGNLVVVKVL